MTYDEALRLAPIIASVDGWCGNCAHGLVNELDRAFPDYDWHRLIDAALDRYEDEYQAWIKDRSQPRPGSTRPLEEPLP